MKKTIIFLLLPIFILPLAGCDNNLSRREAERQICKQLPYELTGKLQKYGSTPINVDLSRASYYLEDEKKNLAGLINDGYIVFTSSEYEKLAPESQPSAAVFYFVRWKITPTGKIRKFIKNDNGDYYTVSVGKISFDKITGVLKSGEYSVVEYTIKREANEIGNMNPFNCYDEIIEMKAYFKHYDDGWRIQ